MVILGGILDTNVLGPRWNFRYKIMFMDRFMRFVFFSFLSKTPSNTGPYVGERSRFEVISRTIPLKQETTQRLCQNHERERANVHPWHHSLSQLTNARICT